MANRDMAESIVVRCQTLGMARGRTLRFWALTLAAIAAVSLIVLGLAFLLAYSYDR